MRKPVSFILVALFLAGLSARADTSYWVGASVATPYYTNQTYWLGGVLPGAADTAIYTNTYRSSTSDMRIQMTGPVTNAVVVLDFVPHQNRAFLFTNADWWVTDRFSVDPSVVARTNLVRIASGTLTVTNASRSASLVVGNGTGVAIFDINSSATLNVDRFWLTNALSYLGAATFALNGTLNVFAGGSLVAANESFTNSTGDFALNGTFNLWGGTTTVAQVSTRGIGLGSGGVLRVSGAGAVLNANWVKPGNSVGSTNSVFWIENGGIANLGGLSVGSNANKFGFGAYGSGIGSAIVTNGGILRTDKLSTGSNWMGNISVVASTLEFTTNTPAIILGTMGSFTFASSTLAFRGVTNANFFNSQVTNITFSGDNTLSLRAATNAMLGSYTFQTNNGQAFAFLDLQGGVFRSTNLTVGSGGKITGSGLVASFSVNSQGTLAPGNSPGTLTFASNLTLDAASVLNIELGGTNSVDSDRLIANGALNLGGTLNVTLIDGYTPGAGDTVDILDWGAIFGNFSTVNLPSAEWSSANLYTDGTLTFASIPEPAAGGVLVGALALLGLARGFRRMS